MKTLSRHTLSEEDILDTYDRLATKWAQKMEARMARQKIQTKHPKLVITFGRSKGMLGSGNYTN